MNFKSTAKLCATISILSVISTGANAQQNSSGITDFKVFGRFMYDYTVAETDIADININTSQIRRARIGASGKYGSNLKFKIEFNTSDDGEIEVTDGYAEWKASDIGSIRVGHFKTPNSLEEEASSRFISTFERAAFTDAFSLNRRLGIAYSRKGENYSFFAGAYGDNAEVDDREEGNAFGARLTYNPILEDDLIVHTGISVRTREQGDSSAGIRYRQRPFSEATSRIISTGFIADKDTFVGLEAAAIYQNFWAAAEYAHTSVNCTTCSTDSDFDGYYIEAGVFFGGKRGYKGGKYARPKIHSPVSEGGMGAISLVARYDTLDLTDGDINGGSQDSFILGAEWWLSGNVHIGVNYYNSDNELGDSTSGLDDAFETLVLAGQPEEQVEGFLMRAQFDF